MEYFFSFVLWWVIIAGALVYRFVIKKNKNRKAAESGEDMKLVRQAVEPLLRQVGDCKVVYAHREEQSSYGRTVRTTYYRYAVAFQSDTLWVIPLGVDKKAHTVQMGQPITLNPANLGKITVTTKEKDGAVNHVKVWLANKEGHQIEEVVVDAENLRKSKWFPLNIVQDEECEAFHRFITQLAQRVASENPGVDALIEAETNEGLMTFGAIASVIGVVLGFFVAPVGLVICLVGLIMGIVSKARGAKKKAGLIVSIVCFAVMAPFTVFFFKYIV